MGGGVPARGGMAGGGVPQARALGGGGAGGLAPLRTPGGFFPPCYLGKITTEPNK